MSQIRASEALVRGIMRTLAENVSAFHNAPQRSGCALAAPTWLERYARLSANTDLPEGDISLVASVDNAFAFISTRIAQASTLDADSLEEQALGAYERIRRQLSVLAARYPVRFWNYI